MKVLHLTLKKKWFDMIASGEKKEEYREIKSYWYKRLVDINFKKFDVVKFRNGYSPNSPTITLEFKRCDIAKGNPEWGAEQGRRYFVITLGEILN